MGVEIYSLIFIFMYKIEEKLFLSKAIISNVSALIISDYYHLGENSELVSRSIAISLEMLKQQNDLFGCSKPKKDPKGFIKPTINEISLFCFERKNNIDAEVFYNFYESNGWLVGKNKMKNWKSAIITWEKNSINKEKTSNNGKPTYRNILQTAFNDSQQAEFGNTERELSEDTDFEVVS